MTPSPAEQKKRWLDEEIWPEIHAMMHNDAYFQLWRKAQEFASIPRGPIAQMVINGYVTYQLATIRRLCDRRSQDDVISLPKVLKLIGEEHRKAVSDLGERLKKECDDLYGLATQYIAHNGDPNAPNWREWNLTSDKITSAQKAICEVALIIERDLLAIRNRVYIIPVPQFDYLMEVKSVPEDKIRSLREFWDAHNDTINAWVHVACVA